MTIQELKEKAHRTKMKYAELAIHKGKGHLTSSLSCAELVTVLYYEVMNVKLPSEPHYKDRDRFVMSKNHGIAIVYPILQDLGFFSEEMLNSYQSDGSNLGTHAKIVVPGIDFAGGSLGIGLGAACGMALARNIDKSSRKVFCLIGDCECHEGSMWESFMFAGNKHLDSLIVIMDRNEEGCTDFTNKLMPLDPIEEKMIAFGWDVWKINNGHDIAELMEVLDKAKARLSDKPLFIIANTIKGHGVDFMEHVPWLHGQVPEGEDGEKALRLLKERG